MAASADPGRSSADRLLAILGAFDSQNPVLNLTGIAARTGISLPTTYRMAKELTNWGALERNADGSYQVGLRLWQTGALAPRQRNLSRVSSPALESLHEATGRIVQLAILDGNYAVVVAKVSGATPVTNVTEVAGRLPLHATGVGKVFLAFEPSELMDRTQSRRLRRFTPATIVQPEQLAAESKKIRRELAAYCRDEMTIGTSSVAAPVFDAEGNLAAALGILVPSGLRLTGLAPAVITAAGTISRRLGYSGVRSRA